MHLDEILSWATEEAKTLTELAPKPPRTKAAKIGEVLARKILELPVDSAERNLYLGALLQHLTPLIRQTFFGSAAAHRTAIESEDYIQDVYHKIIDNLNKYFNPNKGSFASYATMTFRQVASNVNLKQKGLEQRESFFGDSEKILEVPAPIPPETATPLSTYLYEFIQWLQQSPSSSIKDVSKVAHVYWWHLHNYNELPQPKLAAAHLSISPQKLIRLKSRTMKMFREYLQLYKAQQLTALLS